MPERLGVEMRPSSELTGPEARMGAEGPGTAVQVPGVPSYEGAALMDIPERCRSLSYGGAQ